MTCYKYPKKLAHFIIAGNISREKRMKSHLKALYQLNAFVFVISLKIVFITKVIRCGYQLRN